MKRFFGQMERVNEKVKAINRELSDAGISNLGEWRKALDLETPLDGEEPLKSEQREARLESKEGKIEDKSWQNQLNTAFQRDDFFLIKTLQRVRPNNFPDPELVRCKLNELVEYRQIRWEETYRAIREISSVEPDTTVVEAEFSKLFEKYDKEKDVLNNLKNLTRTTGFTPSPEQVQAKYASIIKGVIFYDFREEDLFKSVRELTGIKPDTSLIYEVIEQGNIERAKELSPLFEIEITDEMIKHSVEKTYARIIEKHGERWMDFIRSLEQKTGIKPVFTPEQLRPVFEEYFQHDWYGRKGYIGVEHVIEFTNIKPPVDLVEKAAIKIVDEWQRDRNDQGKTIKKWLDRLRESTDVAFEIPEQEIQNRYQKAMTDRKAHIISNLFGAFGIKPTVDEETARKFMLSYLNETYQNPILDLEKVFNTKFTATDEEVEAAYDKKIEDIEKALRVDESGVN